jgi:hypothetical protein
MFAVIAAAVVASTAPILPTQPQPAPPAVERASLAQPAALSSVSVTLECTAYTTGKVGDCHVLGETHPGMGFGEAAIALMRDAEVEPGARDVQFARTIQFMP